jgi:transposase
MSNNVITGYETWVYAYDPETKTQFSQWSPRPKKARQVRSNIKSMFICFFDQKGIVHKEFLPLGQTVNAAFYVEVLRRLRENVRRKRPDQWQNNTWLLHHDNAPTHSALLTQRFLTDNNMTVVPHPPYSPDLAPSDFFFFPKLKTKLKGRRCQTVEEIQAESQAALITLGENDFQECFKNWQRLWERCQASNHNILFFEIL